MGTYQNGAWTSDTGCDKPVIAVDCDGTINSKAEGAIGVDNGAEWDFSLIEYARKLGCRVVVSTCNDVVYVAGKLQEHGIDAYADLAREYKLTPFDDGTVLVTNMKPLADFYLDDRGREVRYGDDPRVVFARLGLDVDGDGQLDYDWKTPEYRSYVGVYLAFLDGDVDQAAVDEACVRAQAAAARYDVRAQAVVTATHQVAS